MNQNGHSVDRAGRLIACEHRGRCISRIEHDGSRKVLADRYLVTPVPPCGGVVLQPEVSPSWGYRLGPALAPLPSPL